MDYMHPYRQKHNTELLTLYLCPQHLEVFRGPKQTSGTQFYVLQVTPSGSTSAALSVKDIAPATRREKNRCCFEMNCEAPPTPFIQLVERGENFGGTPMDLKDNEGIAETSISQWRLNLIQIGWPETTHYLSFGESGLVIFFAHAKSRGRFTEPRLSTVLGREEEDQHEHEQEEEKEHGHE